MVELNVQVAEQLSLSTLGLRKVLIVDDVSVMRVIVSRILSDLEVESVEATDGYEAFKLLNSGDFDAVVTDVEMPKWSGFELVEEMRRSDDPRIATMPVVVTSTVASKETALRARQYVGVYFLPKPISVKQLSVTLKMIATSRWLHQRYADGSSISA
ncbi:response regulator [Rhodopirellula halodulae]|uniref:response regulator n=1 Tax=Rhodopirellula halodulae TaxID=2894198 RepID=UPI001E40F47F|nr:response regulator [Rhodopirellula sp. JC737]MCC9658374.1 response regulator [Rhodopirellula sp. JC737]